MATVRERKPGVWEIRVFTGRDASGRPTQISKTVRGTKREAQRVAATLESRPPSNAAGRTVTDVLAAWRDVNQPVWAESTRRDYESRIARIESDPIAAMPVARLRVADVERWHARMRKTGVGEAAIRGRHSVLRAALAQALRWEWVGSNPASQAVLRQPKRAPRRRDDARRRARRDRQRERSGDVCPITDPSQVSDRRRRGTQQPRSALVVGHHGEHRCALTHVERR